MIIFGTRGYLYQLAVLTLVCGWCGNPAAHALRKRVTRFTLFFVPLFPFSTKFATQCTFCGGEQRISKEQADELLARHTVARQGGPHGYDLDPAQGRRPGYAPGGQGPNPYRD
ncbi:zinc-ribbon domain-containing protein [Streptomyces sp. PTD5-9]|uniref:zinc-ribbon domain-containing protein n=1 Tax=Streptomyces sp. PTD5-9 TaxID=3120150 RepID=UPI003009E774